MTLLAALLLTWPQFRGPNSQGIATGAAPPVEFGPGRNVVWKAPVPPGHSSPVVTRDRVYVTGFEKDKRATICLNRKDGKLLWRREVDAGTGNPLRKPNNPASPSPLADERDNVFVFFQDFGLLSYDRNGKERWRFPLGPFKVYYGFGASPVLVDGKVILPVDQDAESFLLAVDARSGKQAWRTQRPGVISGYSTPVVHQGQILIAESFQLSAYAAGDGRKLWSIPGLACEMKSVPSIANGKLYINGWGFPENQPGQQIKLPPFAEALASNDGSLSPAEIPNERVERPGYFGTFDTNQDGRLNETEWAIARAMLAAENGLLAVDLASREVLWKYQRPVPQVPSTVLYNEVLCMVNDSGILISFDPATGAVIKQDRLKGAIDKYFASPVAADGKIWLVSQDGTVSVVKAEGQWSIVQVNPLGEEVFATPAIVDGRIFVRTQSSLYCFANAPAAI